MFSLSLTQLLYSFITWRRAVW